MTQNVLIGVGGSGQHVVHAYLRFLTLTFPRTQSVPHIFILDADARLGAGAEKRSFLIDDIVDLHTFLVRGAKTPACCQILKPFRTGPSGDQESQILGQLLGVTGNASLEALAHGFLADDDQEWGNDWSIELSKGMMANPKVGSIVLAHKFASLGLGDEGTSDNDEVRQFGDLFKVIGDGTRVAIVGSNFGGTGSGVIPALVRQLDSRPRLKAVRAFMCLPWFTIETGDSGERTSAARNQDGIDPKARNSSLGLHTYFDELSGRSRKNVGRLTKSTYVLCQSMPQWRQERRNDDGNFDQRENRHVLNLVQACAIQAFLGLGEGGAPSGNLYSIKTTDSGESRGQFDATKSPHLRFWASPNDSRQLIDLIADSEATAFALEKSGRVLEKAREGKLQLDGIAKLEDQPGLDRFAIAVSASLGNGTKTYGWVNKRETAPDEVFKQLGTAMVELARQIRTTLVWLDGHSVARAGSESDEVTGIISSTTEHLFTAPEYGNAKKALTNIDNNDRLKNHWKSLGLVVTNISGQNMVGSPPISQAFVLFNDLFAPRPQEGGVNSLETLLAEFAEEQKVAKADAGPRVAARVIGKALHRRVIQARSEVRRKDNARDDHQRAVDSAAGSGAPMLSLGGITGTPISDARLVQLKLREEVVGAVDPFSPNHPMSLAYIDPYAGLSLGNGNQLDLTRHTFPEHALRGIPNIAAPHLLQKWRIDKCRPQTDEERETPSYKVIDGQLRATKSGIYLHACRVNEAAFWLLVSADPRIEFVNNLFDDGNRDSAFARLLRKELSLLPSEALPAIAFSGESPNSGRPIFIWNGDTWFLAANSAARSFFASLLIELPTVRNRYRPDNPLKQSATPNSFGRKALDEYFAQELDAAIRDIESFGLGEQEASQEPAAILHAVLKDILSELPPPALVTKRQHRGEAKPLRLRSADSAQAELRIAPHRMVSELQAYFCRPAIVFVGDDQNTNGLLPVTAEAWEMLEGGKDANKLVLHPSTSPKVDQKSLAVRRVMKLQLAVAGLGQLEQDLPFGDLPVPVVQQELSWSFGIWPNFRADNWNYYVISGTSRLGDPDIAPGSRKSKAREIDVEWMKEGMEVALVVKGQPAGATNASAPMQELGRITNGLPKRIKGVPQVLELIVGGRVMGSRRIELEKVEGRQSIDMIGIDFGTSNSCVAVQTKEGQHQSRLTVPLLPGGSFGESIGGPMMHYMDSSGDSKARDTFLSKAAAFFHVKNSTVDRDSGDTVPSELLVSLDDDVKVSARQKSVLIQTYGKNDQPFHSLGGIERPLTLGDYPLVSPLLTPLPPQPYGLGNEELFSWLRGMLHTGDERLFGDLKWPRGGDDGDFKVSRTFRALFLEHIIIAALAVLRSRGYANFDKFVATQPEALSQVKNNFADTFERDLNSIVSGLSAITGMDLAPNSFREERARNVLLVSETVSALWMVGLSKQTSNVSVLTIDVGGGTTDVGVCLRYGRSGRAQRRYTASARFAGNKLLEALAESNGIREYFARSSSEGMNAYSVDALKSLLKSQLRRKQGNGIGTERTGRIADMFFDGLYEYAFSVLHLFMQVNPGWIDQFTQDQDQVLKIALLGNGFKLYEAFQLAGSGETLERYNKALLQRLVAANVLPEAVASRIRFDLPATTKSGLIGVGGLDAASAGDFYKEEERFVLLPKGLTSRHKDGRANVLEEPALVPLVQFREDWLGMMKGERHAGRELSLEMSNSEMKSQFPLTFQYWATGQKDRTDDLQNVFHAAPAFAQLYMDAGALYLTGTPLAAGRSFAWLMTQYAKEAS